LDCVFEKEGCAFKLKAQPNNIIKNKNILITMD
jgi:hypothetical protein